LLQSAFLFRKLLRKVCAHLCLVPSSAMRLFLVGEEFGNIPPVVRVKYRISGDGHRDELMPGMIVVVQDLEEAFLQMNLPGDEEFTIVQVGTNLFFDFIRGEMGFV